MARLVPEPERTLADGASLARIDEDRSEKLACRAAGVDLADPETFRLAFARFDRTVGRLAGLLVD